MNIRLSMGDEALRRLGAVALVLAPWCCAAPPRHAELGTTTDSGPGALADIPDITATEIARDMGFLANDKLGGRKSPSSGLDAAARYAAGEFRAAGLRSLVRDGSYIDRFAYPIAAVDSARTSLVLEQGGQRVAFRWGAAMVALAGSSTGVTARVQFAGTADTIAQTGVGWRGAIVAFSLPGLTGAVWQRRAAVARESAAREGAVGVVFVLDASIPDGLVTRLGTLFAEPRRILPHQRIIPAAFIAASAAPAWLAEATATVTVPTRIIEPSTVPNVIAVLPGRDPALAGSYILVSAHLDHIGTGQPDASGDSIYNGADDNASGSAAVLAIARALARSRIAPARSVIFLLTGGEEVGLLGSEYFVHQPPVPLASIIAGINLDMVSRNAPSVLIAVGEEFSTLGDDVRRAAAAHPQLGITPMPDDRPQERYFQRSDQINYATRGIPSIFLTTGLHGDYHQLSDDSAHADPGKAARVAMLTLHVLRAIANRAEPPRWTALGAATFLPR